MNLISGKENILTKEAAEVILKDNEEKAQTIKNQHQELIALRATLLDACKKIDIQLAKVIVAQDNQTQTENLMKQIKLLIGDCYIYLKSTDEHLKDNYSKYKSKEIINKLSHMISIL